jgi:cysteinyl-tRNA synthetase
MSRVSRVIFSFFIFFTLLFVFTRCGEDRDFRQDMREFVKNLSAYAKASVTDFLIIPQNGGELLTQDGEENGLPSEDYIAALDGVGREDLYYGYEDDNIPTPASESAYMEAFLNIAETYGVEALVTDYCWTQAYVDHSYSRSALNGYISFAADFRELHHIPEYPTPPYKTNADDVSSLNDAKNFLYIINTALYTDKISFINALQATNYDLLIIDLFFDGNFFLTSGDIEALKVKNNGGKRLVISYMSIGEAEDYRYYWKDEWNKNPPDWLGDENPDWPGNYKVHYWVDEWQRIIFGNTDSYLDKIIATGFDGAYLDIIDAFEYWEENGNFTSSFVNRFIHESRVLQMRGVEDAAVVAHRKSSTTKQMQ